MKYFKSFICIILLFSLVEFMIWVHTGNNGWHMEELLPGDAISLWGTVMTVVFLVFSVLALWNIDQKVHDLDEMRQRMEEKFDSIENKHRGVMLEVDQIQQSIVCKAEEQIKRILDNSTFRQNFYDALTRIANIVDPGTRVQEYTHFIRTNGNVEGVNYAYVYICRGDAYMQLYRHSKALSDYEMAAKIDTKTVAPYFALGSYYVNIKDYKKSIEIYEEGLKLEPENDSLLMNIANSYSALGEYAKADMYFDKALTFNPDLVMAYYNKANLLRNQKDPLWKEKSRTYLDHCIEIMPFFFPANINKAALLREENNNAEAAEVLSKVIGDTISSDVLMAILQRGICYRLQGKIPQALNDFNMVLLYEPKNVQNLSNLAEIYLRMGYFKEAMYFAKQGLEEANSQGRHDCDSDLQNVVKCIYSKQLPEGQKGVS